MYGQDQNLLKTWHYQDPPDAREIAKNDFLDSLQGNRNPFIDSVNYVCYIDFNNMSKINGPVVPCTASSIGVLENSAAPIGMMISPNPNPGQFTLSYRTTQNESITVNILDITGRIVHTQNTNVAEGNNAIMLDINTLSAGSYTVQVIGVATLTHPMIIE